jgi:pyrimidine 5'-nucleotidase
MDMHKLYQADIGNSCTQIHLPVYIHPRGYISWSPIPYNKRMKKSVLFFDLDDTLYSKTNGLWEAIRGRMADYLSDPLGFPADEIQDLRQHYFETYGTTLRGLQINHSVDADDYLAYVHDLPLRKYISPDLELQKMLVSLPQQKWIFTNADANHAKRVIITLALEGCFTGIIDVRALDFLCKPKKEAYQRALHIADTADPANCVLFEDSLRNLIPAHELGFKTVLVGTDVKHDEADYAVKNLIDLPRVFPQLWNNSFDSGDAVKFD